jgi:hypothetical protein
LGDNSRLLSSAIITLNDTANSGTSDNQMTAQCSFNKRVFTMMIVSRLHEHG